MHVNTSVQCRGYVYVPICAPAARIQSAPHASSPHTLHSAPSLSAETAPVSFPSRHPHSCCPRAEVSSAWRRKKVWVLGRYAAPPAADSQIVCPSGVQAAERATAHLSWRKAPMTSILLMLRTSRLQSQGHGRGCIGRISRQTRSNRCVVSPQAVS